MAPSIAAFGLGMSCQIEDFNGRMAVPLGFFLGRCDLLVIVGKYLVPTAVAMEGG